MPLRLVKAAACVVVVTAAALAGTGTGCSAQGEGDRCTFFPNSADADINGTSECQSGLKCYSGADFPTVNGTFDRCCPLVLSNPQNVAACYVPSNVGSGDAGSPDAPSDAPSDGHAESDAPDATEAGDAPAADAPRSDAPSGDAKSTTDAPAG